MTYGVYRACFVGHSHYNSLAHCFYLEGKFSGPSPGPASKGNRLIGMNHPQKPSLVEVNGVGAVVENGVSGG